MELKVIIWSDNNEIECVKNILNDKGYRTAGIRKEHIGNYEEECEWKWCKINMIDSICVDVNGAMGLVVSTEQVEEKPMFRYVATFIIDYSDDDDTVEEEEVEEEEVEEEEVEEEEVENTMEKEINVVMNIGMTTKDGVVIDLDSAMNKIGEETDCTITKCVGFYHGNRENSLKVEIYGIEIDRAVAMAGYFAHIFRQECVALTVGNTTVFVNDEFTECEFIEWCDILAK